MSHSRPLLQSNQQRFQCAFLALCYNLNISIAQITASPHKMKLLSTIRHEITKSHALDATLDYYNETLFQRTPPHPKS